MNEIILMIFIIVSVVASLYVLYNLPNFLLSNFEKSCFDELEEKEMELENDEKFIKESKKWLFK